MWLMLSIWLLAASACEAKTITVPKAGKNENQLHQELLAAFPQWGPVTRANGERIDPGLLRVESTATEIRLIVPDATEDAAVQAVVAAHVPKALPPSPDAELYSAIAAVDTSTILDPATKAAVESLKAALLGKTKQGRVKAEKP